MISRIWWVNFLLSAASLVLIVMTIGVLRQNPAIPSSAKNTSDKWPEITGIAMNRKMNASDFAVVTQKNLFSAERVFSESKKEEKKSETVEVTSEPKEIEEGALELFATFSGDSIGYAIVSNPGIPEITKPQIRVKKGDALGDYLIEKIEPGRIIVAKNNESFEVKLKKSKSVDNKAGTKKETKVEASKKNDKKSKINIVKTIEKPTVIPPKDSASGSQVDAGLQKKTDSAGKNLVTEGGETYEIMKTPFGIVKRKVK